MSCDSRADMYWKRYCCSNTEKQDCVNLNATYAPDLMDDKHQAFVLSIRVRSGLSALEMRG